MTTFLVDKTAADAGGRRRERSLPASRSPLTPRAAPLPPRAGYPPSTRRSMPRLASDPDRSPNSERLRRIRAEYLEMPGLCLTLQQAQRLWSLEPRTCAALLAALIDSGFLRRTATGLFVLRTSRR